MESRGFRQWFLQAKARKEEEKVKQKNQKKVQELQQEVVHSIKKVESLTSKVDELDQEIMTTKKKISDHQKYMKELEDREIHLNNEYIQLLEKQNSGTQERVNVKDLDERVHTLEGQIQEIEHENKGLKEKLDSTNTNVGSFISEMSTLLDTHELQSILNMEVDNSDEEEEIGRMLDVEYDEQRPHAGTGGSSKMKSRPNPQGSTQLGVSGGRIPPQSQ